MSAALNWHRTPEAVALFELAYAQYEACGRASDWFFPYDIEADLEEICNLAYLDDGECPASAWHQYYLAREAAEKHSA